jgi:hypothetical protein
MDAGPSTGAAPNSIQPDLRGHRCCGHDAPAPCVGDDDVTCNVAQGRACSSPCDTRVRSPVCRPPLCRSGKGGRGHGLERIVGDRAVRETAEGGVDHLLVPLDREELGRLDAGTPDLARVPRRVPVGRVVAATDLAAIHSHPQMHPARADLQTSLRSPVGDRGELDRVEMGTDGGAHVGPNLFGSHTSRASTCAGSPNSSWGSYRRAANDLRDQDRSRLARACGS